MKDGRVKKVRPQIKGRNPDGFKKKLELLRCPVCLVIPKPGMNLFFCASGGHLGFCGECFEQDKNIQKEHCKIDKIKTKCPICRDQGSFTRNLFAESMLSEAAKHVKYPCNFSAEGCPITAF